MPNHITIVGLIVFLFKQISIMNGFFQLPKAKNEPVYEYAPGSQVRKNLQNALAKWRSEVQNIPMYIGGKEIRTGIVQQIFPPHDLAHKIDEFHIGNDEHARMAIDAALAAKESWESMPWEQRAAIFLKAADLFATKYRYDINHYKKISHKNYNIKSKLLNCLTI